MIREKLHYEHKKLLFERLKAIDTPIAEYSFANIFLFRKVHNYEVIFDNEIFIKGKSYDGYTYLMPTVPLGSIDFGYLKRIITNTDFLFPIPETWLSLFNKNDFVFSSKEGDMDYVYNVLKMSTYKGRKLHKKRNLLKQFITSYESEAQPLTENLMDDARIILRDWLIESGLSKEQTDYEPCMEALDLYEDLVLCGGMYYADSEPAGFIVGEEINRETFVLHFAKGRKKFKGIYQYMFNNFSKVLPISYKYLNLEQDLDNEYLRVSKMSYVPDLMIKKMRVGLRKK